MGVLSATLEKIENFIKFPSPLWVLPFQSYCEFTLKHTKLLRVQANSIHLVSVMRSA